jgi:hypothetical protein
MLIIRKNDVNNLVVTASMNKTLSNPYYLFSFQHITSKERVSFLPEMIISNTRYDKFRFIEGSTNLANTPPVVQMPFLGQYYYSIYEQLSPTNTDIALTYNKLESGRANVIVDNAQPDLCFFEPYISSNENEANYIFVSEQEDFCISGDTTPVCPSGLTGNCPTYITRYSPTNSIWYKNTGTTADFLSTFTTCAPSQIAMDESRLFMVDGCSNYYQYDYTITSGACFNLTLVDSWELWASSGTTPNASQSMAVYDQDNLIVGESASYVGQTGSTLYLYNLTTSGLTKWLEVGNSAQVYNVYYNTGNTQTILTYGSASGGTGYYQLYSGSTNPQLIAQIPITISIGGSTMYFSGGTQPIAVNVAGLQFALNFSAGTMTLLENQSGIPIYYVKFDDGFGYIASIAQQASCYTYDIQVIPPIPPTPSITPTNTPTPSITPSITPTNTQTITPTPSATPPAAITPNTYNALWWFDYTNPSSLTVVGGSLQGAQNLSTSIGGAFSGTAGLYPTWNATAYEGVSGATTASAGGLSNALGLFMGSYSAYTTFVRFNGDANSVGNIQQSDNETNYTGQTQGYRWWSLSDYLGIPPDFVRAFTFDTTGGSWTEPSFAYSGGVWYNIAVRTYQSGVTAVNEIWVNGSLVSQESTTATIRTSTNPIFSLMSSGINYKTTEQFFIPSKLSDADMGVMFNYFNSKYV